MPAGAGAGAVYSGREHYDSLIISTPHFCLLDLQWQPVQRCTDRAGGSRGDCEEDMS